MPTNNNRKIFENLVSKTKVYLVIIAIILIALCFYDTRLILPAIFIYALIVIYSAYVDNKRKTEISNHIEELTINVDSTAKKTLINSPFPLVIMETNGNVIWKSFKFVNEFMNIDIGNYLEELALELKEEIENRENKDDKSIRIQIEIKDKTYQILGEYVKSNQDHKKKENDYMMILYFIDNTANIKLEKKYTDSKTCVGIIMVDNYEEVMQRITGEDKPRVMAELEKKLYDWSNETGGIMIKTERDTFIFIFEQKYLAQIKENKFSILDTIKDINIEGRMQVTLSIAISNEGETNHDKFDTALAALDIALGRGGDQAIIRENGKYDFFGGRAQEVEKRTKVKARIIAHALEELMNESKDIMIMGHSNGDIDSMGSSLGLYRLAKTLGKEVHIVNNTFGLTLESFIESLQAEEEYKEVLIDKATATSSITSETLLIIVDTHKKSYVEVPELLEKTSKIVVIDHHRRGADYIDTAMLTFHEVYASSASELVTEILQYTEKDIELSPMETESLYAGIMVDTKNFTFKTGVRTFEAAAYLRKCGVDIIRVKKWFQSDLENYNTISQIVAKAQIIHDTIGISIYDTINKDAGIICAKAADELLTISNITASFVIGDLGERVSVSGRSIGDINVQVILEAMGGGGHMSVAGAQIEGKTTEEVKQELIEKIEEYFLKLNG